MSANIIPYISVADNWKKHFTDMVNDNNLKRKKNYIVGKNQHGKGDSDAIIKMVTTTKEAIDRARAVISKKKQSNFKSKKSDTKERKKRKHNHCVGQTRTQKTSPKKKRKFSTEKKFKFSL